MSVPPDHHHLAPLACLAFLAACRPHAVVIELSIWGQHETWTGSWAAVRRAACRLRVGRGRSEASTNVELQAWRDDPARRDSHARPGVGADCAGRRFDVARLH